LSSVVCDETTEVSVTRFSHKIGKGQTFSVIGLTAKFTGVPLIEGLKLGGVVFDFAMLYLGNGARESLGDN